MNPNMPVGNIYDREEIVSVVEKAKANNAMVIIDEAYYYFYDNSALDLIKNYDNVIILRTFPKCFLCVVCEWEQLFLPKRIYNTSGIIDRTIR